MQNVLSTAGDGWLVSYTSRTLAVIVDYGATRNAVYYLCSMVRIGKLHPGMLRYQQEDIGA